MTGEELIRAIQALPSEQRVLPVHFMYSSGEYAPLVREVSVAPQREYTPVIKHDAIILEAGDA